MSTANPDITFTVTADTIEEAAQFAIDQLKDLTEKAGHRGFMIPELTGEMVLVDGTGWKRAFEFKAEFLPKG